MPDVDLSIGADFSPLQTGMAELRNFGQRISGQLGGVLTGFFSAGIITEATRAVVEYGARIYDLGKRFHVSTTDIQEFGHAAERNGASLESLALGFNRLDVSLSRARQGNKEVQQALENLGIPNWRDQSLTLAQAMLEIGDGEMNAADMAKVLGRNGTELRETLRSLANGSEKLSEALDPGTVNALKAFDVNMQRTMTTGKVFIGEGLLAPLFRGIDSINRALGDAGEGLKKVFTGNFKGGFQQFLFGSGSNAVTFDSLKTGFADFWTGIKKTVTGDISGAGTAFKLAFAGRPGAPGASGGPTIVPEVDEAALTKLGTDIDNLDKKQERNRLAALEGEDRLKDLQEQRLQLANELEDRQLRRDLTTQEEVDLQTQLADLDTQIIPLEKQIADEKERAAEADRRGAATVEEKIKRTEDEFSMQRLILTGHQDEAELLRIELDYDEKIKKALDDALAAKNAGNTLTEAENNKLASQLEIQKQITLETLKAERHLENMVAQAGLLASGLEDALNNVQAIFANAPRGATFEEALKIYYAQQADIQALKNFQYQSLIDFQGGGVQRVTGLYNQLAALSAAGNFQAIDQILEQLQQIASNTTAPVGSH